MDGGADLLMLETVFDALNAKAAIFAIETLFAERGMRLPVIVSSTLTSSGPHPRGTDHRGFLYLRRTRRAAGREPQLLVRRQGPAALPGAAGRCFGIPRGGLSQCGSAERHGRLRRDARDVRRRRRGIHAARPGQSGGRLLRHHAPAHLRTGEDREQLHAPPPAAAAARDLPERAGTASDRSRSQLRQCRRAHQRRRLGQVRAADPRKKLRGSSLGGPRPSRSGRQYRRCLHGRRPDRRSRSHARLPQPDGF